MRSSTRSPPDADPRSLSGTRIGHADECEQSVQTTSENDGRPGASSDLAWSGWPSAFRPSWTWSGRRLLKWSRKVSRVTNSISPAQAWQRLLEGNDRFVAGDAHHPNQGASRRSELVNTQNPFAVIFGCADSRLAAEIIFDLGLGDAFVVRTAGHVLDDAVLGSLEYSIGVLGVPLIVVMGHDRCGAVTATKTDVETGQMPVG